MLPHPSPTTLVAEPLAHFGHVLYDVRWLIVFTAGLALVILWRDEVHNRRMIEDSRDQVIDERDALARENHCLHRHAALLEAAARGRQLPDELRARAAMRRRGGAQVVVLPSREGDES